MNVETFLTFLEDKINTFNNSILDKKNYMNFEKRICYSMNPGSRIFHRNNPHTLYVVQSVLSDDLKHPYFLDLRFSADDLQHIPEPFQIDYLSFNKKGLLEFINNKKQEGFSFKVQKMPVSESIDSLRLVAKIKENGQKKLFYGLESDFIYPEMSEVLIKE